MDVVSIFSVFTKHYPILNKVMVYVGELGPGYLGWHDIAIDDGVVIHKVAISKTLVGSQDFELTLLHEFAHAHQAERDGTVMEQVMSTDELIEDPESEDEADTIANEIIQYYKRNY